MIKLLIKAKKKLNMLNIDSLFGCFNIIEETEQRYTDYLNFINGIEDNIFQDIFKVKQNFLVKLNKNENEKKLSQDNIEDRQKFRMSTKMKMKKIFVMIMKIINFNLIYPIFLITMI